MTGQAVESLGTGSYVPDRVVTHEEIAALVPGVTPEWTTRRTAISTRRYAADDEATSDLAAKAAFRALESANLPAGRVDRLTVSTSTGDRPQPPPARVVRDLIGCHAAVGFDHVRRPVFRTASGQWRVAGPTDGPSRSGPRSHSPCVERYGILGSASVPVTLDGAVRSDLIHDGDLVLMAAFGGGMSVGVTALKWSTPL